MTDEQYNTILKLLEEIKDLLKTQSDTSTKITVVNTAGPGRPAKGLKSDEDFTL
ncbi:MAG: hypothetical protein RLZZ196_2824 [Bacteroidota bacterium]|jgi:hypothetical protein